jgi:phosphate transport system protein
MLRDIRGVKRRLTEEATNVVGMLESALSALWDLDTTKSAEILKYDDRIDTEEVAIEEACFRVMALQAPVARDFRMLTFILKVNSDVERIADHACSVAKITFKLADEPARSWPTSLREMGDRVPITCHALLRAMHDENADAARQIVLGDKTIDRLNRQLFDEVVEGMASQSLSNRTGLLMFRLGRELERVGDLSTNIAEDIVYLATGEIIRHTKKRMRAELGDAS